MDTLTEFTAQIRTTIHDSASDAYLTTDAEIEFALDQGKMWYSKRRPQHINNRIPSVAGQYDYDLSALLSDWVVGFSLIEKLEYPDNYQEPSFYDEDEYMVYKNTILRFLKFTPGSSTDYIRLFYTTPHTLGASTSIPDEDQAAVINYASAQLCFNLAAKFARADDPNIAADAVAYRSKSQEYASTAKNLITLAKELVTEDTIRSGFAHWAYYNDS